MSEKKENLKKEAVAILGDVRNGMVENLKEDRETLSRVDKNVLKNPVVVALVLMAVAAAMEKGFFYTVGFVTFVGLGTLLVRSVKASHLKKVAEVAASGSKVAAESVKEKVLEVKSSKSEKVEQKDNPAPKDKKANQKQKESEVVQLPE